MKDIASRSLTAVFWGTGGAFARIALQLCTQIALARILGPEQYGLFAIGAIVISFSNFFSDIGIAYGLIQKNEITSEDLRFVFTWQLIIGSLVTLAIAGFSESVAAFFGEAKAQDVVSALAVVCVLNSLAAPSNNMLKRTMDFKRIQIAQLAGYIGGYIVLGLPLALAGAQVWALVTAWIAQATIVLVILYLGSRHPLRPLFWHQNARTLSSYGATVLVTNIINWLIGNIDRVIIGRFFAGRDVGLYATTYNMLQNPTSAMLGVIQPVFFSASSRIADNQSKIANGYYALIGAIALCILPPFASASTVAETIVLSLYGKSWIEAASIFQPLALAMPFFLVWGMTTPLLWTGGKPGREFKTQLPFALLWLGVSWLAAHHSIAMVGWAVCCMFILRSGVMIFVASRTLSLSWLRLWVSVRGGVAISIACAATTGLIDWILLNQSLQYPLVRFSIEVLAGITLYILLITKISGLIPPELSLIIGQLSERCPDSIGRHLRNLISARNIHVSR